MNQNMLIFALASLGRLEAQLQSAEAANANLAAERDALAEENKKLAEELAKYKPKEPVDPTPPPVV